MTPHPDSSVDLAFSVLPVTLSTVGIFLAYYLFKSENDRAEKWSEKLGLLFEAAKSKFYIDEVYQFVTKKIIFNVVAKPLAWIDKNIVDGFVNMLGSLTEVFSVSISGAQSGKVQSYAAWMLGGVICLIGFISYLIYMAS